MKTLGFQTFLFVRGKPRRIRPEEIKTKEEFPKELSYKIVQGGAAEPKIVQKIVAGKISLYVQIDLSYGFTKVNPFAKSKTSNINNLDERGKYGKQDIFGFNRNTFGIIVNKARFFLGKNNTPFIEPLPKNRVEMMKLFNHCPQAMVKYRDVPDKEFDFIEFLNYYNVNCISD